MKTVIFEFLRSSEKKEHPPRFLVKTKVGADLPGSCVESELESGLVVQKILT